MENINKVNTNLTEKINSSTIIGEIIAPQTSEVNGTLKINEPGKPSLAIEYRPDISFATKRDSEKVYALIRKHWVVNIGWVVRNIIFIFLPLILIIIILSIKLSISFLSLRALILLIMLYYSYIFSSIIKLFFNWYFNLFFFTDERIIQYKFNILGKYNISELELENINDIKQSSGGFLGQILNYGDIEVCGENVTTKIILTKISDPIKIRTILTDLLSQAKKKYVFK